MKKLTGVLFVALMLICITFTNACAGCVPVTDFKCDHANMIEEVTLSADCLTDGTLFKKCPDCNFSEEVTIPALWHDFVDGICSRCGLDLNDTFIESFDVNGDGSVICSVYQNGVNNEVKLIFTGSGTIPSYSDENLPPWNAYKERVTLVVVEDGITAIGSNAFSGYGEIMEVVLPYSLTIIGDNAFRNCGSLSSLNLSNIGSIGSFAFSGCGSLGSIYLGEAFTDMGEGAFENSGVTDVTIDSNASLGEGAFSGCGFLQSVTFPYIEIISTNLFSNCTFLSGVIFSDNLKVVGNGAFSNTGVEKVVLPDGVTEIGDNAFNGCNNLTEIYVPASVQQVGSGAFDACSLVENVYFSGSLAEFNELFINSGLNNSSTSFEVIEIPATPSLNYFAFDLKEDGTYEVYASGEVNCPANLVLPIYYAGVKVTSVKENGFANVSLTSVLIPDNYTEIKAGAFENSGLSKIYWLGEDDAFSNITLGENNAVLEGATLYLYRTEYPFVNESGYFWHLVKSTAIEWSEEALYKTTLSVICDTVDGNVIVSNASIELERINYYRGNFTFTSNESGEAEAQLPVGDYYFIVKAQGCKTTTGYFTIYNDNYNNVTITLLPAVKEELKAGIKGHVSDLETGNALAGITVLVRAGKDVTSGQPLVRLSTDYSGNFTTDNLENGDYTLHFFNETGINSEKLGEKFVNVTIANNVVTLAVKLEAPFIDYSFSDSFVYNGHTYYLFLNKLSWSEAKLFCESKGGYLAKIDSAEENAKLVSEFSATVKNYSYEYFYFGANDKEVNNKWTYTDGSPLTYTNWLKNQPDNASHNGTYEYCGTINLVSGGWNDMKDDGKTRNDSWEPNGFIMEVDYEAESVGSSYAKYLRYNGHDYYFFLTAGTTWKDAAAFCKQNGGYLTSITTADEQKALQEAFSEYREDFTTSFFMGLSDEASEGTWVWESGEPYSYKNWDSKQPDNYEGVENYTQFKMDVNGTWNDLRATSVVKAFVMEVGEPTIQSAAPLATIVSKAYFNGHTYILYSKGSTWSQADQFCKNLGGHLATISSPTENSAVAGLLSAAGVSNALIGFSKDANGVWSWSNGETTNYTSWGSGEPNNQNNEYVCEIYSSGNWNDINGEASSKERYFVLEYDSIVMPEYDRLFTYNGHTYMLIIEELAWTSTKALAQSIGGHLVTITTRSEELAIEKALDGIGNTYVFMGATDCEREGDWHWVTAEGFNYQNWASTQPDNAGGTEHFGQIYFIDNQIQGWNDLPNTGNFQHKLAYIIEFDYLWN